MSIIAAFIAIVGGFVTILGAALLIPLWAAWWLYPAWDWFIAPLGFPSISFVAFCGVMILCTQASHKAPSSTKEGTSLLIEILTSAVLSPIFVWFVLRVLHGFQS